MQKQKELDIYIVSYKRPQVLSQTLAAMNKHITPSNYFYNINVYVAVNDSTEEYVKICNNFSRCRSSIINSFGHIHYEKNYGKAYALNHMVRQYAKGPQTTVITMDEDMVFTGEFMSVFDTTAELLKFDLVGFASKEFWGHYPLKDETMYLDWHNGYKVWYTTSIAGGIMMCNYDFLMKNEWTNVDGVYGGDDFNMCFLTDKKFIVEDDREWLVHDPIYDSTPELEKYHNAKKYYRDQGLYVYPHNWYEDVVGENNE